MNKLRLAIILTFLVLGILLWAIFWAAMWILGVTGTNVIIFTFGFVGVMILIQWALGPIIIKAITKMKKCEDREIVDMVHNIADEVKIPRPKVFLVHNPIPNAFAFGRTQKSSAIALHTGLIEKLSKEELRGVIAHEIGHIKHRDVLVMTLASTLPILLFYIIYFGTIFASSRDRGGGVNYIGAFVGGMVAQFLATLLVLYLSRVREYYADSFSARITKEPQHLAGALAKISYSLRQVKPTAEPTSLRAFYICNSKTSMADYRSEMEKEKGKRFREIFMTHPLTWKRIRALEKIKV